MNRNRNLVVDFQINHRHDHYINHPDDKHVQPSFVIDAKDGDGRVVSRKATKKKRKFK